MKNREEILESILNENSSALPVDQVEKFIRKIASIIGKKPTIKRNTEQPKFSGISYSWTMTGVPYNKFNIGFTIYDNDQLGSVVGYNLSHPALRSWIKDNDASLESYESIRQKDTSLVGKFNNLRVVMLIAQQWNEIEKLFSSRLSVSNSNLNQPVKVIPKAYLFQHFDSRGGSMVRISGSEEQAKKDYGSQFGYGDGPDDLPFDDPGFKMLIDDDYVGPVRIDLYCETPVSVDNDLLYNHDDRHGCFDENKMVISLWDGDTPPNGLEEADEEIGEDAFGLLVF